MSRSAKYRPVVLLRRALLAALALFMGVVVAVFIDNQREREGEPQDDGATGLTPSEADAVLIGKGFDYQVTDGSERLFHIRADRILTNRDNVVTLEGVELTVERESGSIYKLAADAGRYDTDSNTARVEGNVILSGDDGVELRSETFDLLRKGTVVKSRNPVRFKAGDGLSGSAQEIEGHLDKDRFQLTGRVRLFADPGDGERRLSLSAKRVLYEQEIGQVHAEGGVVVRRGRDRLNSQRIAVTLDERSRPSFVRARWEVRGVLVSNDPRGFERILRLNGDQLSLAYDDDGESPRLMEVAGTRRAPARLEQTDESGLVRRFVTDRIEAAFQGGQLRQASTASDVIVIDFLSFDPDRELGRACAGAATARFNPTGDLVRLVLDGDVDLHRPGLQATGDKLVSRGEELIEVSGEPAQLYAEEGELNAPQLAYRARTGSLQASDGVRAWLPPDGGFSMVGSNETSEKLPIRINSDSADWEGDEGEYKFEGNVRAWQGESFLTAKSLVGRRGGTLRGEGGIKTVLEREPSEGDEPEDGGPVEVTAQSIDYSRSEKLIEYRGRPEVREGGRLMSCNELDVLLGESSRLSSLRCSGNALVDDKVGGHKVRGSEALYRPDDSKVEVSGAPVTLENPDGAVIKASRVIYDFDTATAQFLSGSSSVVPEEGGPEGVSDR